MRRYAYGLAMAIFLFHFNACDWRRSGRQAKFEPLYRSAKAMQAATGVGLSYQQLGELLQKFATEVAIAADNSETSEEKVLVAAYGEALMKYKDSHTVWNAQIQSESRVTDDVEPLVAKYKLPIREVSAGFRFFENGAIQRIWEEASGAVNKATALYFGKSAQ
jgi:hypothetical protein